MRKVIITCAVTGAAHTPSMSPHIPVTAGEIVQSALEAVEAGAAIVHLHARNPQDGRPDQDPERFEPIVPILRERCDAVINITTGGSPAMTVDERLRPAVAFQPELASLNLGSMNFGLFPMLERFRDFKFDWESAYLNATRDLVFKNTFADIERILGACGPAGTRFEFECYDTAHLYTLEHMWRRGLVKPPFFVQGVFGILGGIGAHRADLQHMRQTAERLFGDNHVWSAFGAGRNQLAVAVHSMMSGGHVRVGLEDSLWSGQGALWRSNAEQVQRIRTVIESLGFDVATPDEAREILALRTAPSLAGRALEPTA